MDSTNHPSFIRVKIKQSKVDPFRKEVGIIIGRKKGETVPSGCFMAKRGATSSGSKMAGP